MEKRTFFERFTSRPFLASLVGFVYAAAGLIQVLQPNVPEAKINAVVALVVAGIGALGVFIHGELKSDREKATAAISANNINAQVEQVIDAARQATAAVDALKQVKGNSISSPLYPSPSFQDMTTTDRVVEAARDVMSGSVMAAMERRATERAELAPEQAADLQRVAVMEQEQEAQIADH